MKRLEKENIETSLNLINSQVRNAGFYFDKLSEVRKLEKEEEKDLYIAVDNKLSFIIKFNEYMLYEVEKLYLQYKDFID